MTEAELAAIEERANAATPGPWVAEPARGKWSDGETHCAGIHVAGESWNEIVTTDGGVYGPNWPDAQFIAAARSDIPALVAEVKRLRAELAELREDAKDASFERDLSE